MRSADELAFLLREMAGHIEAARRCGGIHEPDLEVLREAADLLIIAKRLLASAQQRISELMGANHG